MNREDELQGIIDFQAKEIKELKVALVKYGVHKDDCGLSVIERCSIPEIIELGEQKFECPRICDCGYKQALGE